MKLLSRLAKYSSSRGQDATGIAIRNGESLHVLKRSLPARRFLKTPSYSTLIKRAFASPTPRAGIAVIGHCRLATNGDSKNPENNQPVARKGIVLSHNGIVVNESEIETQLPNTKKLSAVDTEVLTQLIAFHRKMGLNTLAALKKSMNEIEGTAAIAALFREQSGLVLSTNFGSLYFLYAKKWNLLAFASEKSILLKSLNAPLKKISGKIHRLAPKEGLIVLTNTNLSVTPFSSRGSISTTLPENRVSLHIDCGRNRTSKQPRAPVRPTAPLLFDRSALLKLRRCSRCILPGSFPHISFDSKGVCNVCRTYRPKIPRGKVRFNALFSRHRSNKVLLALSGGRDSCYALHYLVRVLGLDVVAYTYDWGVVTDLARRNMSRMCHQLGVEHIVVSADIETKRRYIRKNILAWLRKPLPGLVPLFMAGDKQFFHYANQISKANDCTHLIFGMNPLERTDFKVGFAGISNNICKRHYNLSPLNQARLVWFYIKHFLQNPRYINASIFDTVFAYFSYYVAKHPYSIIYDYLPWNESTINRTLIDQYGWETAPDAKSTWRIGDGTAAFYNYIYLRFAGFTEAETFRSNQVREGHLTRDKALGIVLEENRPRFNAINWYCQTIGIDFDEVICRINEVTSPFWQDLPTSHLRESTSIAALG